MILTRQQIEGWKMNNGSMSTNEFMALCDLALKAHASEGRSTESSLHAFTLRDAIKDGLPPDTALVHWSDALALEMRLRHAPSATAHGMLGNRAFLETVAGPAFSRDDLRSEAKLMLAALDRKTPDCKHPACLDEGGSCEELNCPNWLGRSATQGNRRTR